MRKDEVYQVVERWWRAWIDNDQLTIEEMTHRAFTGRSDTGRLQTGGIGKLLAEAAEHYGHCAITEWELFDTDAKHFDRVVVCSYAFRIHGRQGGQPFVYEGHATDVLSKDKERWTIVSHDGTFAATR